MMCRFNYFLWMVLVLMVFTGFEAPAEAHESSNPSPEEVLKKLREKQKREEKELVRLSEMVLIPSGKFVMGRNGLNSNEEPAHTVYLDAFYMNKYEVTQLQYLSAIGTNPSYFGKCPLCPVEKVTFQQASQYCAKVRRRLPTEAEWEKAARGGTTGWYYWDQDHMDLYAWYGNNAGKRTRLVGTRNPNRYGLYDMAGNVWEWVQDWYDSNYYPKSPQRNPNGPPKGTAKVIRGGSWGAPPEKIAHAHRDSREPDTRYINGGFRCAKDAGKH
jgi:formylglycine-generating enzyme required for sulfatase activity